MKKNIITTLSFAIGALLSFNLSAEIERYPLQSINRPGIMPVGITQFETHAKLKNYKTVDITAGMLFGIANHLHGEFSYDGISVNPFTVKRTVNLGAKYNYYKMSHVSFSATAGLPIHIRDGEIIRNIKFGLPVVFFNHMMAGSILGNLLNFTMRENVALAFNFPFWYGIQAHDQLWLQLNSSFGHVEMINEKNASKWAGKGFWQELPLELEASYAVNHYFDVGLTFGFSDVMKAKDTMVVGLNLAARAGRLFE